MTAGSHARPSVLFVCAKNAGKSQMAAALMRLHAGQCVDVHSAGTTPGPHLNADSRAAVEELGATFTGEYPKGLDAEVIRQADRVIVIGDQAKLPPVTGMRAEIETWLTDEPSDRGIGGADRMRLIRDDLDRRIRALLHEMGLGPRPLTDH